MRCSCRVQRKCVVHVSAISVTVISTVFNTSQAVLQCIQIICLRISMQALQHLLVCGTVAVFKIYTAVTPQVQALLSRPAVSFRLSFKRTPLYVGIDDQGSTSTREGLEQGYCVVPSAQRFLLLFTFLKKNMNKKVCGQLQNCPCPTLVSASDRLSMQRYHRPIMFCTLCLSCFALLLCLAGIYVPGRSVHLK